jgi:hypothetical protein
MYKKIIIFLLLFVNIFIYGKRVVVDKLYKHNKNVEYKISTENELIVYINNIQENKDEIFNKLLAWVNNHFKQNRRFEKEQRYKNNNEPIIIKNNKLNTITIMGFVYISWDANRSYETEFKLKIEIEDNKFKLTFSDILYIIETENPDYKAITDSSKVLKDGQLKKRDESLYTYSYYPIENYKDIFKFMKKISENYYFTTIFSLEIFEDKK